MVACAKPKTEFFGFLSKKQYAIVLVIIPTAIAVAASCGFPCAVKHADSVCAHASVNADKENIFTNSTRVSRSAPVKLRKIIFTAGSAKKYKPTAAGKLTKRVIPSENNHRFRTVGWIIQIE